MTANDLWPTEWPHHLLAGIDKNLVHFWQTRVWKADSKLYLTDVLHFGEKTEKLVKIGAKKKVF